MPNEIEKSKSGRAKCRACGEAIAAGELRLAEEAPSESVHFSGTINRYYHLECAVRDRPRVLVRALQVTTIEIPDREELEAQVKDAIETFEARSEASLAVVETADEYRKFAADVAEASPASFAEAASVFADWLQSVGDPRGELIAFHHALESAPVEQRGELEGRVQMILARNAKTLVPEFADIELSWQSGFVEAVSIRSLKALVRERLEQLWQHPSMLAIRTVEVRFKPWSSVALLVNLLPLPSSVRTLEIALGRMPIGPLIGLEETSLTRLSITGSCDVKQLESRTLETLELRRPVALTDHEPPLTDQVRDLDSERLPALSSLALHMGERVDDVVSALAASGLIANLSSLTLSGGLSAIGATALASSGAKLAHLDISDNPSLPLEILARLADVAGEVVHERPGIADKSPSDTEDVEVWKVRHVRKPEWGVGVVVEESDDHIEIEFENAGRKIIRGLELIEDA